MVELLAPAGDLEKLKIALLYGADAVFIGGQNFSLRARASNFSISDIKEGCDFAHQLGKKIYITTNIIPHHEDFNGLIQYLKELELAGVDGIIAASPYIIDTALNHTNLEVHISTQQSTLNTNTVNYWTQKGASRVVLGRELSIEEIKEITKNVQTEIEVFIHGGMCMSYSGRCSLSDNLTLRDANRGGCAHSCRWNYHLYNDQQLVSTIPFSMSSKDLEAINQITKLIDAGVASLKIEGRMKSLHYIATVVKTYRQLIDEYTKTQQIKDINKYANQLKKAENRLASTGFLEGIPTLNEQLYQQRSEKPLQNFVGLVLDYDPKSQMATIEQRNYFSVGDQLEVFAPIGDDLDFVVSEILDLDNQNVEIARHPQQILKVKIPFTVSPMSMLRKNE